MTTDFATAATATLKDLQCRVGLEGWWVLRRNDREQIILAASDEAFGQDVGTVMSWEDSYCRQTVEQDAPAVATDVDKVSSYTQARTRNGLPARSLIVVPLTAPDGSLIGTLRALGTEVRPDLEQHLATVQVAGDVLGVLLAHELELAEQVSRDARLKGAAHTDALTGIGNRRAWDSAIASEEVRCARHADQAAVIVLDVEDLKVFNETYGHHAGDQLLSTTAAVISERIRHSDVVARVGGDEFAVLLPRTGAPGAQALARDLRRVLRAAGIVVSTGVAGRSSRTGLAHAWHQADAAMHRNRNGQGSPLAVPSASGATPSAAIALAPWHLRHGRALTRAATAGPFGIDAALRHADSSRAGNLPGPRGSSGTTSIPGLTAEVGQLSDSDLQRVACEPNTGPMAALPPSRTTSTSAGDTAVIVNPDTPSAVLHSDHSTGQDSEGSLVTWLGTAADAPPSAVSASTEELVSAAVDITSALAGGVVADALTGTATAPVQGAVESLMDLVRRQLGAQVAYISVFADGQRRMRNLVTSLALPVAIGDLVSHEDGPSWHVANGHAPSVCPDVATEPALACLPDVRALGIRSFAGVPLRSLGPGSAGGTGTDLYGSLCVFSQHPEPSWGKRDAAVLQAVTEPLMRLIQAEDAQQAGHHQVLERLDRLDAGEGLQMHFQPVVDLHTGRRVGAEALARFPGSGLRPDEWFAMAATVGAGAELELRAVSAALPALQHKDFCGYLAVNLSPQTACAPALPRLLAGQPLERVVVEITEHEEVTDYDQIRLALAPMRAEGLRLAVDDTGAGYASMRHVLSLVPDLIKLDISLVRDIHTDPARRALAAAMTTFATATGAQVIAEGIETAEELACLRGVGVHHGQGYHLARPAPLLGVV